MDSDTIGAYLGDDPTADLKEEAVVAAIREMCDNARRRMVYNFSGALPGPPRNEPSLLRRFLQFLQRRRADRFY